MLPPIPNLDFETFDAKKNRFSDWGADQPGVVSFVETNRLHGGKACLRMEPSYGKNPHGHARLMRTIEVTPGRRYRFSVTTRTEGLKGKAGCLRLQVYVAKGPNIGAKTVKVAVSYRERHPVYGKIITRTKNYHAHDEVRWTGWSKHSTSRPGMPRT